MNTYLTHRIHGTSPVYLPTNLPSISAIHVDPMEYLPACGDFVVGLRMAYHSQARLSRIRPKNEHAKPRISNAKKANITKPTSISLKSEIYIIFIFSHNSHAVDILSRKNKKQKRDLTGQMFFSKKPPGN